ncbi:MAG: GntR family transcriptional regulator [Bacillota bacterium]
MFIVNPASSKPIYQQIIEDIKEKILKGIITPGEKLPSVRELAKMITINPNTIQRAYQELEREKVIVTIRGKGTFISTEYQPKRNQEEINELKDRIKKELVEARYMGLQREDILELVAGLLDQLEGGIEID